MPWRQWVATMGGDSQETLITIASERTPAEFVGIRELVDNANDFSTFPIISFNFKKVPVTKLARRVRSTYKVAKDIEARLTSQQHATKYISNGTPGKFLQIQPASFQ